jgi:hypothetical protein
MLEITKHAEERYVERVMGYTDKAEITTYINQNRDMISERLNKMIEYGELIYTGKIKEGNVVNIFLKDTWILIADRKIEKIITLYKVDIITGDDDFNKTFVDKMMAKIAVIKDKIDVYNNKHSSDIEQTKAQIEDNKAKIRQYEDLITKHRQLNNVLGDYLKVCDADLKAIDQEYKTAIEDLVSNRIF